MGMKRVISWAVLVLAVIGAIYYSAVDKEAQGAIIVLLGVLYFVALPHLTSSGS